MTSFACVAEVKLCKFHFESNKSEYSLSLPFFYVALPRDQRPIERKLLIFSNSFHVSLECCWIFVLRTLLAYGFLSGSYR